VVRRNLTKLKKQKKEKEEKKERKIHKGALKIKGGGGEKKPSEGEKNRGNAEMM